MTTGHREATPRWSESAVSRRRDLVSPESWQRGRHDVLRAVVAIAVLALCAWLDRDRVIVAQQAAIFAAIVGAISWLGSVLGAVGTGIAATAEAAVVYLASALGWVAERLGHFILSSGAMFAKVWEWTRRFFTDLVKPALLWLKDVWDRVTGWLRKFFQPVFDFLNHVRDVLKDVYTRFIRPILTALDIAHAILKTLGDLGVSWARALDRWVVEAQQAIDENWRRLTGWLNELRDIVTSVVTPGRLFQQIPFVRTLERDAGHWIRIFWNTQVVAGQQHGSPYDRTRSFPLLNEEVPGQQLAAFYRGEPGPIQDAVKPLVPLWRVAAGVDPPPPRVN